MALPPGFLDELRTRTSLAQVVGRKVMWDSRKSNAAKGDLWAPCPFHQEKTASFHVDDRKGFYYCFGCHAKGDAIGFVKDTENVSFIEAVEILAGEVGMQMPAPDPQAQAKADRNSQLADVMEQAVQFFRMQLQRGVATDARQYLTEKRGLGPEVLERWEIGFAPDAWQGLWDHLRGKGVAEDMIFDAGLAKPSSKGGKPYDTFRNRIIFPIRDHRGRAIAFGGRAMDPNDNAKYLNSPETALFDKGRTLYNIARARTAAGKGQPLIVAEGYMDVIALSEAGFEAVVAPLGTAVTETQMAMLWRLAPEPVIALDGDTAGLRAARRLVDLALPLAEPGQSLRFAMMPEGQDPDDLIRAKGAKGVEAVLEKAVPLVRMLWDRELAASKLETPEQRADLDRRLREAVSKIRSGEVRYHYQQALKDLMFQTFRAPKRRDTWQKGRKPPPAAASMQARASLLARDVTRREIEALKERVALAILIRRPDLVSVFADGIESFDFIEPGHQSLALTLAARGGMEEVEQLIAELGRAGQGDAVDRIFADPTVKILPALRPGQDIEVAKMTVAELLATLEADRGHRLELEEATHDIGAADNEVLTRRLDDANQARYKVVTPRDAGSVDFDRAPNGMLIDRSEKERFDALLSQLNRQKGRK
ncbi:DNA primase [Chachezhania antarctica]|uniref:DNA primase n=1 Tax=Chachezhania antarctica TaxID=2340860 RepID=UPI000EB46CB6|nr:DNA primase [Chachezhania antarctica]|tara:strand:- start:1782 stop:3731 length:1950 start_codon:yes stop_codon:yes gene_type:complete